MISVIGTRVEVRCKVLKVLGDMDEIQMECDVKFRKISNGIWKGTIYPNFKKY